MKIEWRTTGSIAACLLLVASLSAQKSTQLDKPVRLKADGAFIDTGKDIGYAGPLFVDYDRDGKPDLLVTSLAKKTLASQYTVFCGILKCLTALCVTPTAPNACC